jgi:YVTN family beta-propeller protein
MLKPSFMPATLRTRILSLSLARLLSVGMVLSIGIILSIGAALTAASPDQAPGLRSVSSSSLALSNDGNTVYSANFDAGSLSKLTLSESARQSETALGIDLRRLALNHDESQLLITDYLGETLWLIDTETLQPMRSVKVQGRPFGVVYDRHQRLYWVTLFEAGRLLGISDDGAIVHSLTVPETPRGLALMPDRRLLITHAMTGQLSIWRLGDSGAPSLQNVITLEETHDPDQFVSQGQPRLLDDIAIAPDGQEAWLPHLLWNFDHPFQFQSTIFPAVSVIALTPGAEKEKPNERKQLFQQIDIPGSGNRTRIVSNPHDAEFSADGRKVYVTLAGSEDLLVFDRARASTGSTARSKRRQGKRSLGGAQATQIFRHIPGDNPRGLLVLGDHLYVQNAMSHELVALNRGGDSPFAQVSASDVPALKTVGQDRLDPQQRLGARLFHSANSSDFPDYPMTGDFWMSCQSCHVDGFNFSNRYLVQKRFLENGQAPDPKTNAVAGHARLEGMIAGDFLRDYIRLIQDTQGGLGHDARDHAKPVDAEAPPAEVLMQMNALHQFIVSKQNLPFLATWLRLDAKDQRTVHPEQWINSAACADCHADMFEQWADSNHRLMAQSNPYYRVLEDLAAREEGEAFRAWCSGCHNPERVLSGLPFRGHENHMFEKQAASLKQLWAEGKHGPQEGTGCLFCHRITRLEDAGGNAAMSVNLADRPRYLFEHSSNPLLAWLGDRQINAKPEVHARSYLQPFYRDEAYCKACHNEFSPGLGAMIVDTWGEWAASSFNRPDAPEQHRGCIDCHMHGNIDAIGRPVPGQSTSGGRHKANVVTHQFTGANHFLLGLRNPMLEQRSLQLLRTSARLEQRLEANRLTVRVSNVGAGHALPTGVSDFREFWLQITVRDRNDQVVFRSGMLDEQGEISPDTRVFMKVLGDAQGQPVGLKFWRYARLLSDTRIPADGHRDEVFELPEQLDYPLTIDSRLMYRVYPQWVTNAVRQSVPTLPDPPVIELNRLLEHYPGP